MIRLPLTVTAFTLSAAVSLIFASAAAAQLANLSNSSSADLLVGQDDQDFVGSFGGEFSSNGSPVAYSGGALFGDEESGEGGVFGIVGSASAEARFGFLRAAASATVTDNTTGGSEEPFFNADGSENEFGIPDFAGFNAFATFRDRLQYGGTARNYESTYFLRLTGEISGSGFAVVTVEHGENPPQHFYYTQPGSFAQTIVTQKFGHVVGPQYFSVRLQASVDFFADSSFDGESGTAAFGNTLELIGVELRDADTGELLTDVVITTESGEGGTIAIVPEPATAALVAMGSLMLLSRRTRGI